MNKLLKLIFACCLILLSCLGSAQQTKSQIAKAFELKGIKLGLTEAQIIDRWKDFKCIDISPSSRNIYPRICYLKGADIPASHELATLAGQSVDMYVVSLLEGKVRDLTIDLSYGIEYKYALAGFSSLRDAMVERFGKPTRFHMSRGVEQGMAQWKTNPETLTILVWPEHVALELKVNNIDVEARKEALRKLEAQRDAKDL